MKYPRRRLPIPQYEFGFVAETFNLIVDYGVDGDRVVRERAEVKLARRKAESRQVSLSAAKLRIIRRRGHQRTPKRTPNRLKLIKPSSVE